MWKTVDPDGATTFYLYNNDPDINHGQLEYTISALSSTALGITTYSDLISQMGTLQSLNDRFTRVHRMVVPASSPKPDRILTEKSVWLDGDFFGTVVAQSEASTAGTNSWRVIFGDANTATTNSLQVLNGTTRVVTAASPDNSYTVSTYVYGRLQSVVAYDSNGSQLSQITYSYDPHDRQYQVNDARNGATT